MLNLSTLICLMVSETLKTVLREAKCSMKGDVHAEGSRAGAGLGLPEIHAKTQLNSTIAKNLSHICLALILYLIITCKKSDF